MENSVKLYPAFSKNNIPIVFSCDKNFVPYTGVCIKSLLQHISPENNYDIVILEDEIPDWNKKRIQDLAEGIPNCSIRFYNILPFFKDLNTNKFFLRDRYTLSTYYRFFIPLIMNGYSKILYLDADILIQKDVADLYHTDLEGNIIGAVPDIGNFLNWYGGQAGIEKYRYAYNYLVNKMHLDSIENYFQAGVMIMDLDKCRAMQFTKKCIHALDFLEKPLCVDQDILNLVVDNQVKMIDLNWNFQWHLLITEYENLKYLPYPIFAKLQMVFDEFYIIHYCSYKRPWALPDEKNADLFWAVAKQTVFYEQILYANFNKKVDEIATKERHRINYNPIAGLVNCPVLKLKYFCYRVKKLFYLDKKKKNKYKQKIKDLKTKIKETKKILREVR